MTVTSVLTDPSFKACRSKHLSSVFPFRHILKRVHALSSLPFIFSVEHAMETAKETQPEDI